MNSIDARSVLDYFRELEERRESTAFDTVLDGLLQIFAADEIGLSAMDGNGTKAASASQKASYPWQIDPQLLERIQASPCAKVHQEDSGAWLVSVVERNGSSYLAWAQRTAAQPWRDADRWPWFFASQALVRWRRPETSTVTQRLEQAAVVTGRLTHDFGNFLTGIMGFTELSLSQAPADSLLNRYLQEVYQAARAGADWVRRLHLFCRRGAASSWPSMLSCVLAEEQTRLQSAEASSLSWKTDVPANLPLLDIDAAALQSVLAELVDNANQAIKGQGTIGVSARVRDLTDAECRGLFGSVQPGSYVELAVVDDGPGIPADVQARLFHEMFFSTKPRHRGLGFLVVYGILHRFGGGLRLASPNGKGTAVQVYIPAAMPVLPATPADDAPRVLLAHADPLLFESMRRILESSGCQVSVAISAQAALSAYVAADPPFALVVADVLLPPSSGINFVRRILAHDSSANFLFLHAQSSFHGLTDEDLLERFALLRWPLTPQTFLRAVQTELAKRVRR